MPKPNEFTLSSDFASFAADSSENTISITINSGSTVPTSSPYWQNFAPGGSMQSFLRSRMYCSKDGKWGAGTTIISIVNVSIMSGGTVLATGNQALYCTLDKTSDSDVRLRVFLEGFSGYTYRINETVTIQAVYSSFINPML